MTELESRLAACEAAEDHFGAMQALEALRSASGGDPANDVRLGVHCLRAGRVERARALFQQCVDDDIDKALAYLNLGHAHKALGDNDKAVACYSWLVEHTDETYAAPAYLALADLKDFTLTEQVLGTLVSRLADPDIKPGYRALMQFALGYYHEEQGYIGDAFAALTEANNTMAVNRPFRGDLYAGLVMSFIEQVKGRVPDRATEGPAPIFIVGLPRSGTTLVEQILASHSQVEATDELRFLDYIAAPFESDGGLASKLDKLTAAEAAQLASEYVAKVEPYRVEGRPYFIDKNPANFLNIGLIMALFPNARVINIVRDVLDNTMGVYKQYFHRGNEFSFTLEGIIYYWQGYVSLMQHWMSIYPDRILNINYETLTATPDEQIRRILDYCGLPEEAGCFRSHETTRPILTPSASQVRQPISRKGVRSGQKYEPYLEAYLPALVDIDAKAHTILGI